MGLTAVVMCRPGSLLAGAGGRSGSLLAGATIRPGSLLAGAAGGTPPCTPRKPGQKEGIRPGFNGGGSATPPLRRPRSGCSGGFAVGFRPIFAHFNTHYSRVVPLYPFFLLTL